MVMYKRKYINLNTYSNAFSVKQKGVFGSVVLEQKNESVTIKVKVSGLSLGDPHSFNAVFYDYETKQHIYITLGYIKMINNQGNFKVTYEDGKKHGYNLLETKAFFIEIESVYQGKNLIFLSGEVDKSYTFDGDLVKFEEISKKDTENLDTIENIETKKTINNDIIEETHILGENNIIGNTESSILDNRNILEEGSNKVFENNHEEDKYSEFLESENNEVVKEDDRRQEIGESEKEDIKTNSRKGKKNDYYKVLFDGDDFALDIFEKLKEEVENLAELTFKDDEEIALTNRKTAIVNNAEEEENSIENIFTTYPEATPFEYQNFNVEWRKIKLQDLGVLQRRYWKLFYESIIVNAVDQYNEILLGKYVKEDKEHHLLAVKDEFLEDKVSSAISAGAIQFKSIIRNEQIVNGVVGYWIIKLKK